MEIEKVVRIIFDDPDMSEDSISAIVWGCTGYPHFWSGRYSKNPVKCFIHQLRHAKMALDRGFTIDDIFSGKDKRPQLRGQ